jgi:hypothetical protein
MLPFHRPEMFCYGAVAAGHCDRLAQVRFDILQLRLLELLVTIKLDVLYATGHSRDELSRRSDCDAVMAPIVARRVKAVR